MNFAAATARIDVTLRPAAPALAFAYVLLLVPPFVYQLPATDLDASWITVITYGAGHGWQWGRDILFTYGPLGFLRHNVLLPERFWYALALNSVLACALHWASRRFSTRHRLPRRRSDILLLLAFAVGWGWDAFAFQVLPVLAVALCSFAARANSRPLTMHGPRRQLRGSYALIYSSAAVTAVAMCGIIDVVQDHAAAAGPGAWRCSLRPRAGRLPVREPEPVGPSGVPHTTGEIDRRLAGSIGSCGRVSS